MSVTVLLMLLLMLCFSGVFSGSETGVYSLSRLRLDAEVGAGSRSAMVLARLLRNDAALLITLLVGNNLMLELLTTTFEENLHLEGRIPTWSHEIAVTMILSPVIFFFGELLPKDLFRRRPSLFLKISGPLLGASRLFLLPLVLPLQWLSAGLERLFGLRPAEVTRALGREEMLEILEEGKRTGVLEPHAEELARNVLVLRETPVERVMIPWSRVRRVDLDAPEEEVRSVVEDSEFTRLPALRAEPGPKQVVGYLHQLDVLGNGSRTIAASLRPMPQLQADLPLDRALVRLRNAGQRLALVGRPEAPRGIVFLMDLLAAISSTPR